jgi:hypothetical protein
MAKPAKICRRPVQQKNFFTDLNNRILKSLHLHISGLQKKLGLQTEIRISNLAHWRKDRNKKKSGNSASLQI